VTKRKKPAPPANVEEVASSPEPVVVHEDREHESVTTRSAIPADVMRRAQGADAAEGEAPASAEGPPPSGSEDIDVEMTVNLTGDMLPMPGRDDLDAPTLTVEGAELEEVDRVLLQRKHLRGLVEALVFASDSPIKPNELAKLASAPVKQVREILAELKQDYATRGIHLDEVANGWVFRTSAQYAPFIRDLTKQKPVRLTRAQVETLAIIAYRQPITRPEIDDVRGVDSGPVLKVLLERDLVRILGKRDEPGRPLIYGTTTNFLEFFGLRSLKDLPTLREFTELTDESREKYEEELGEPPHGPAPAEPRDTMTSEHDEAPPHESMRVPRGADELDEPPGGERGADLDAPEGRADADGEPVPIREEVHASEEDGPTLTSEAPARAVEEAADGDEDA
jgi:segregation and condensation protein B